MALTPQNNDAFFREVDEELRREQLASFWTRYGKLALVAVVLALAAFGGFLWWQHHRAEQAGRDGEALTAALTDLNQSKNDAAKAKLAALGESPREVYRAMAGLTSAALAVEQKDEKAGIARFKAIAGDQAVPEPFRNLALIRQTTLEFDTLPPAQVIKRLKPIAVAGNPWFGSAGEMVAIAHLKLGQRAQAAPIFAAIARDMSVPESLRSRTARMAGLLGIDTVADRPAAGKE